MMHVAITVTCTEMFFMDFWFLGVAWGGMGWWDGQVWSCGDVEVAAEVTK
jgi:hypothetical protein